MKDKEKLEARKAEILKKNNELNEQFVKVNNWITQARNEYVANLGRIDEIDKLLKDIKPEEVNVVDINKKSK